MAEFLEFLGLPRDADEEAATIALTALLTSAVRDKKPFVSIEEIHHKISTLNGSQYIDALNALPLLLESPNPKARDLLGIIGECCSAKEALIAAQEYLERLTRDFQRDPDDETEQEGEQEKRPRVDALVMTIDLYTSVIPRLKLRSKSAFDTVEPHIAEVQEAVAAVQYHLRSDEATVLLDSISSLVGTTNKWLLANPKGENERETVLSNLLSQALSSSFHVLNLSIAQRTFEDLYPRFKLRRGGDESWKEADQVVQRVFSTYQELGPTSIQRLSIPSLIRLAHTSTEENKNLSALTEILPLIIASIQSNSLVDESLAVLLKFSCQASDTDFSPEVAGPLLSILPELASGHPDPQIRHISFRILSRLLSKTPPPLRIQVLVDLTLHSEFPQMRVAAIGLVKEALLEALASPSSNPFASPEFVRIFGPILFQPSPPDLFTSQSITLDEFEESQEPKRLVECLSLYYVLLERDKDNRTGIRDSDILRSVENTLLAPLRAKLKGWASGTQVSEGHDHDHDHLPSLLPLEIALERVDAAKSSLN